MEAKIGVMGPQAKERLESAGRYKEQMSPRASGKSTALPMP